METAPRNPWPVRLAIAGAVFLLLGAFLVNSQGDAIDQAYDPREVAIMETTGSSGEVGTLAVGCYYALTIEGANNVEVNLTKIEGSARVDAPLKNKICASDWIPMATDGTAFIITSGWSVEEGADYALDTTCQADKTCTNDSVYLVHTNTYQYAVFESPAFLFGIASCCSGLLLLPLAGVVMWLSRVGKNATSVVMMNPDGTMSQAKEITPEMMAAFARGENPLQPKVDAPFADTGLAEQNPAEKETFVDGKQSVMSGNLLTTEQVYALMRGDVEQATQQVPDPFKTAFSEPNAPKNQGPVKDPNTKTITSWDEGVNPDTKPSPPRGDRQKVQPLMPAKEKQQSDADWKSWDDI